jgi:hypothetical protein
LRIRVQALAPQVPAGGIARYAIWVSLAGKASGTAKITITANPGKPAPRFTLCSSSGGAACSAGLTAGQPVELRAVVAVPKNAAGTHITLTAAATSPQAAGSVSAAGSVLVTAAPAPAAAPPGTVPTPMGVGAALPAGPLPQQAFAPGTLPALPGPVANPALAFPTISPGPAISPGPKASPPPAPAGVSGAPGLFPLGSRLTGGQIIGLAVLAAGFIITVARLSARGPRRQRSRSPPAG